MNEGKNIPKNKLITVIGGSGFLGSYIAHELLKNDFLVKVVSRYPEESKNVKTSGAVGQVVFKRANIYDYESVVAATKNSYAVINAVGTLFESGEQNFENLHLIGAANVARACKQNEVAKLIHISALGVDRAADSEYAKTKLAAEQEITKIFPNSIMVRPSLIFGAEDKFFNNFACMIRFLPCLPLIGGGNTKFQPVYVGDVARAVRIILQQTISQKKIYELGGPRVFSFKDLLEFLLFWLGKKRILIPISYSIAKIMASLIKPLPLKILTVDQVKLLQYDNIILPTSKAGKFSDLGLDPQDLATIVPKYLKRFQ